MTAVARIVFSNWPLKLTALGLAVVLYMGLAISESTRSWTDPVPIEVLNAPVGGALLSAPGTLERIDYRAPDDVAETLTNDSFRASIDLSAVQPQVGAFPVEVPVDVFPVDPRVRVIDYEPPGVLVQVDEVVTQVLPVEVDHGPLPEGIELGPISVEPALATVSGASSRVQNVRTVEGRFVVDASGINIDEDVVIDAFDEVGVIVPGVDVQPAAVRVRADVERLLSYATLPVVAELVGEPARGKRVDNVSTVPATVTVSGTNPAIRQLDSIMTEALDISDQSVELVAEVPLALPEEVSATGEDVVTVIVTFTESIGSRTFEIGTALTGAQPGFAYQLEDPSVDLLISGPVRQLDELDVEDVSVQVPVAGLEVGDNEVMPIVRVPRGLTVVRLTPATVTVNVADAS